MKQRKFRLLAVLISAVMLLSVISGCSGGTESTSPAEPSSEPLPSSSEAEPASEEASGEASSSGEESAVAAEPGEINNGEPITLLVDMHSYTPTLNTEPTPEKPEVILSTQKLADAFTELHPNVTIEWVRTKPQENAISAAEWFTTQIAAGTGPAVAFTWNNAYLDRGWYYQLDEFLDTPNEYMSEPIRWKEQFPDYIWTRNMSDVNNNVVTIPLTLSPGPATAYYYNMDLFDELGLEVPGNWEELLEACKTIQDAGYMALAPWDGNPTINTDLWPIYFSIGPAYAAPLMDELDYDKSGVVELSESLRGVKAGYFNPVEHEYAREVLIRVREIFTLMYPVGFETTDFEPIWNEGNLAMKQNGTWGINTEKSNTKRTFEFGMFPAPIVTKETSEYVAEIPYTEAGPYQPDGTGYNILKPTIDVHGEGMLEAAVAYLKFMTVPENLSELVLENGSLLGAVRGCAVPATLEEWISLPFPINPNMSWPIAFTSDANESMSKELEMWVKGQTEDDVFFAKWNELQQKSADDSIVANGVDTTGW